MTSSGVAFSDAVPIPVLWFYGADAVGKSSVGWEAFSILTSHGVPTAYVDTDYLAFCNPQFGDQARLVELNLTSMWPHYAQAGARCLGGLRHHGHQRPPSTI